MGITALIPDMTIGQLLNEAAARWGEIWDPKATRTTLLLLCPRKERKLMELHGDMVDHGQPVVSVFHRPRAEAHLLEEQGLDPRMASFQFVNIATADMGPWMQQLVNNEGWLRSTVALSPTPFSVGLPSQRAFESVQTICFRHPSLPSIERYFLPYPVDSMPGKCFVSLPRKAAAEMARQQAEVLGVGRLEKPATSGPKTIEQKTNEKPAEPPVEKPAKPDLPAEAPVEAVSPKTEEKPPADVPLPPVEKQPEPAKTEEETVPLPPVDAGDAAAVEDKVPEESKEVELPEVVEETVEISEMETELRAFFQELIDAGVEPAAFMDDPRWEDISERAIAEGLETWPILLQMTAMA